jgi:hypothetical protein
MCPHSEKLKRGRDLVLVHSAETPSCALTLAKEIAANEVDQSSHRQDLVGSVYSKTLVSIDASNVHDSLVTHGIGEIRAASRFQCDREFNLLFVSSIRIADRAAAGPDIHLTCLGIITFLKRGGLEP